MACLAALFYIAMPAPLAAQDIGDIEDHIADDLAEDIADDLADEMEERLKIEERLAEDLEDDLADALEDQLKVEEKLARELEDTLEEHLEDGFEQAHSTSQKGRDHKVQEAAEERVLTNIENWLDEKEARAIPGERLVLIEASEVARLAEAGIEVVERRTLGALGLILVKLRAREISGNIPGVTVSAPTLPAALQGALNDLNHLYTLEVGASDNLAPANLEGRSPLSLADKLNYAGPPASGAMQTARAIGLIDTSIDTAHACLEKASIEQQGFVPEGARQTREHGTSVASILLAHETCGIAGLLQGVKLYNASVFFRREGGGETASVESLVRAVDWLVARDVAIINMSLSGPPNALLHRALQVAASRGILIVAAVGNAGPAAAPRYPAAWDEAVGITAADSNDIAYVRAGRGPHVAFAAPGVDIAVALPGALALRSGTSMAAPFATALFYHGLLDPGVTMNTFERAAIDLGKSGFDDVYGHGLLQASRSANAQMIRADKARTN